MSELSFLVKDDLALPSCRDSPRPFFASLLRRHSKNDQPKIKFKERVVIFGAAKVGKSAIIQQFLYDRFPDRYSKTIEDLYIAEYNLSSGASLTLEIMDTAGSYQFPAMRALSISNGGAFILVFSIDNEQSWNDIKDYRQQIVFARGQDVPIVVVGNRIDDTTNERKVKRDKVDPFIRRWRCGYVECSAKANVNIVEIFEKALIHANIQYDDLNEAVCRRRRSLPVYPNNTRVMPPIQRNSCSISQSITRFLKPR